MRSGGNNFNYFSENKVTKLANLVQFKLCFVWRNGPHWPSVSPLSTPLCLLVLVSCATFAAEDNDDSGVEQCSVYLQP